jgi:hypothetical protein
MAYFGSCYEGLFQDITDFCQQDDESFSQCWKRFKCSIFSWSSFNYELGNLLAIFCRGLNPMTCQFDLLSDEEFLSKNAEEGWDYLDELAQKPQFCELTEIEIEPLFFNEGVILALTEISEVKWDDEPVFDYAPHEDSDCTLDMPLHEKTFEVNVTSTSIESPPPQELERVELIDFLGVDNYDCVYNPFLVNLVNTLYINLVQNMHLVELHFLK